MNPAREMCALAIEQTLLTIASKTYLL